MTTLFFDTSGAVGLAAWYSETGDHTQQYALGPGTARQLLAAATMWAAARGKPQTVAVAVGPAQRTGALRAGVAAANALAWGWGVPITAIQPGEDPRAASPVPDGNAARPRYTSP